MLNWMHYSDFLIWMLHEVGKQSEGGKAKLAGQNTEILDKAVVRYSHSSAGVTNAAFFRDHTSESDINSFC